MPANTASEQADVIGTIEPTPESLESGAQKRKNGKVEQIEPSNWVLALGMNGSLRGANCQTEPENLQWKCS